MSKVLIVLTSHSDLGSTGRKTGYYVPEAAHPWKAFTEAGFAVDFASPKGGEAPPDGVDLNDPVQQEFLDDASAASAVGNAKTPEQLEAADYDAVLYVGGHGTMWDLPDNTSLARVAADIYEAGGVVAAVCHGPAGLVNLTLSDGCHLVDGKQVTAFTNDEEAAAGLTDVVPFLLQDALTERGAHHSAADNFVPHVVVDGRLVTGQNPASATGVARKVLEVLDGRSSTLP